ncbi:MAG: replication-relaxation family protein [Rudaea sp.]|nr:replication-relaxation family protein [Rudaea sp.]
MNVFDPDLHKRASRWDASATGKPIVLTPRDLDFLFQLFIHGPLSTAMLRALIAPDVSQWTITERLKHLKRKPNGLIEQPWQQRAAVNANYNHLVVALSSAGLNALLENARITPEQAGWYAGINENRKTYEHDTMAAYISASLALGCREDADLTFISWLDIFSRDKCPATTKAARNPLLIPFSFGKADHAVIPDGLCGISHRERGVNFYAIEADRNTEPIETSRLSRSSIARHLWGYRFVLRNELYRLHYGLPNLQVLTITTSEVHMQNIMAHLKRAAAAAERHLSGAHPFLFKAVPVLGRRVNKPPISGHILTESYRRVDDEKVSIG